MFLLIGQFPTVFSLYRKEKNNGGHANTSKQTAVQEETKPCRVEDKSKNKPLRNTRKTARAC